MISIIDYGAGNLRSIRRALEASGADVEITGDPDQIRTADRLVLPGVGNARAAMNQLHFTGIADAITANAQSGTPLLGICLGMQLLFGEQEEGPTTGLGLLDGEVIKLKGNHKVPQMGWNTASFTNNSPLADFPDSAFYFVHSYYAKPAHAEDIAAETDYGLRFPSIVVRDNIWGMQFHPEKSHNAGLSLLQRWLDA